MEVPEPRSSERRLVVLPAVQDADAVVLLASAFGWHVLVASRRPDGQAVELLLERRAP